MIASKQACVLPCLKGWAAFLLSRRHDHIRMDLAGYLTFTMAAGDRLRRAVRRELRQTGITRVDLVEPTSRLRQR